MAASFSVLTEPWIPTRDASGRVIERGLLETLIAAHELAGVSDPAPPVELGIYRLLMAFVTDALAISDLEDIEALLGRGRFPEDQLVAYMHDVGEKSFDLFHPVTPFLQSGGNEEDGEPRSTVARLYQHLPTGTFATHFHHIDLGRQAFSPAVCVRALATIAPFMTAGGAGYSPSVNGNPPWYVLISGGNLFEAILLNCPAVPIPGSDSAQPPAWRAGTPVEPKKETRCTSTLEGLTWRPRRIRLIPGPGGKCSYSGRESPVLVREVHFGFGLKATGGWTDPQVAYRFTDKGAFPLRPQEDRELWRDIGPLMLLRKEDHRGDDGEVRYERPVAVDQLRQLKQARMVAADYPETIEVYGIRTDGKMKIFEWQHERLSLPPLIGENPRAGRLTQAAMEAAEWVAYAVKRAVKTAYPRDGASNQRAFDETILQAQRTFWSILRPLFETEWLNPLAVGGLDGDGEVALLATWRQRSVQVGQRRLDEALEPLDADAESLRRQVDARSYFRRMVSRLLYPEDKDKRQTRKGRG